MAENLEASLRSSVGTLSPVDHVTDAPAVPQMSPPSDYQPNDHPLNLTKHKHQDSIPGTPPEEHDPPSMRVSGPVFSPEMGTGPTNPQPPSRSRPSSFSLKTSPSKFLSSPADKRRGWSRAARQLGGWSELGGGTVGTLQPAYDNPATPSAMLSTSSSVLDRVGRLLL